MLRTKVIADNILNLTDARYFAAFGVDYLVFNLSNISQEQTKEISDWVEGVLILIEINEAVTPQLLDFILKTNPTGFVSLEESILTELKSQFPDAEYLLREESKLSTFGIAPQKCFAKPNLESLNLDTVLADQNIMGIIVEGDVEEKVGFKNFDELDDLFEKLMVED